MAEPFNPYGLHAIRIPLALLRYDGATGDRKGLSWGAKVFYGRLALFLGKPRVDAFCNPDLGTMAAEMGTSGDTVGRWLVELTEHGFIKRIRRGRGRPAECIFLPHPCLSDAEQEPNSATLRTQSDGSNSADLRNQKENPTPQNCNHNSATLRLQLRNSAALTPQPCGFPNKEENIQEDVHENVHDKTHDRPRAPHAAVFIDSLPKQPQPQTQNPSSDERQMLTVALAQHMGRVVGRGQEFAQPGEDDLNLVLAELQGCSVLGFCNHLRNMSAKFQAGGSNAPKSWTWFISTARSFAATLTARKKKRTLGSEPSTYVPGITAREALREHLHGWGIDPEPPDDDVLESIMEAGTRYGATVDEIIEALDSKILYANRQRERTRPQGYPWFVTTVATEFRTRLEGERKLVSVEDQVRRGLRNSPEEDEQRMEAF